MGFSSRLVFRLKYQILRRTTISKLLSLKYTSLNSIDRQLETFMNFDSGYYVELGANNGISFSNSLYFERYKGWTGLLIEPAPELFKELTLNRASKNYFSNVACVGFSYDNDLIALEYSDLMTTALGIESDIPDPVKHAKDGSKFWGGDSFRFFAPAKTLSSVLDDARSPTRVNFLSLDVEGVELEVLRGVDHSKYRFQYLCIESRSFKALNEYLELNDYKFVKSLSPLDYLFTDIR